MHVTREPDGAIGQGQCGGQRKAQWMFALGKGTGLTRIMRRSAGNIRVGLMGTFLAANPFGALPLIIMSVAGEPIAVRAERDAVLVKAALEAGVRLIISIGVTDPNGA